jgi:sulfatase modifying factor 1
MKRSRSYCVQLGLVVLSLFSFRTWADNPSSFVSGTGLRFVLVESGEFIMGKSANEESENQLSHRVVLTRSFYICTTEITFDLFDRFWKETQDKKKWEKADDFGYGRGNRPAIGVEWFDAIKFCNWLSLKERLPPAYSMRALEDPIIWNLKSEGYRLPTEAEWEYAAKGGPLSKAYIYAGSDNPAEVAWYGDNSGWQTHEVGTKKPNELGIYDMSGNVGEYCWNWLEFYEGKNIEEIDPKGPGNGEYKAVRGGAHMLEEQYLRTYYRYFSLPSKKSDANGIRIVRFVTSE